MPIQHIIFDLGNVLVHIHPEKAMEGFMRACGLTMAQVKSFYLSQLHLDFMAGKFSGEEFYEIMSRTYDCRIELNKFREIWELVIGEPKSGIPELVEELARHYRLSLLSNTDPWHWELVKQRDKFLDLFDNYFLSFELGINKPDPAIFEKVLERLNSKPESCIFIDDTEENIMAAKELGIQAILASDPAEIRRELAQFTTISL